MADTFLGPVIDKLVQLLGEEANLLKGVHGEVENLKGELKILEPFLRDAESKMARGKVSDATKEWLKQLREQAERIEDVVDEYVYHVEQHRHQGGFVGSLRKAGRCLKALKPRHNIASEIREIEGSLRKIKERGQSYGLSSFEQGGSSSTATEADAVVDPRIDALFVEDEELVGIESTSNELVRSLVEGPSTRTVISLVGEGGIGKTTLAKKVYDSVVATGDFDCCVWITVSQSYNMETILKKLKNHVCPTMEQPGGEMVTIEELITHLRNSLTEKRLLKVLDFANAPLDSLPKEELPVEIKMLRKLHHLVAYTIDEGIEYSLGSYRGVRIYQGFGRLEELHTLSRVEAYSPTVSFAKELQKLTKLKILDVSNVTTEMGKALGEAITKMNYLEALGLTAINEDEVLDLKCISSPPLRLCYLQLKCRLQEFPSWISELHNLRGLELNFSRLIDEPLKCLKCLPNLGFLHLYQAYDGDELHFEEGGFQKLKQLAIIKFEGLKEVKIDKGALPLLEKLDFGSFPLMKDMCLDIQHLPNLKFLEITDMPREFVIALQPDRGTDYWRIQHIPSVNFLYHTNRGANYYIYKLGSSKLLKHLQEQAN